MEITIDVYSSIFQLPESEYCQFHNSNNGTLFYDRRFLIAAEQSPLLAVKKIYYLIARTHGQLLAVLPAYLQDLNVVDPFQILANNAGIHNQGNDTGLFSHIMHCFDTTIPSHQASLALHDALFCRLRKLAMAEGASYFGLLNVQDPFLLKHVGALGLNVNFMLERWYVELSEYRDFDHFIEKLPYDGRNEMRRQIRKFDASQATLSMLAPPFDARLEQLAQLCQDTTARHGTPHYFPAAPLTRFSQLCGDLVRLNLIELNGSLIAGMVCFEQQDTLHLWSAGMRYDQIDFSPYTLAFANAYRYAFEHGLKRLEAGRLNAKIKTRLGLQPERLYTVTSERLNHSA
ncbi:GNAT family N-acetyltransferase [Yersinia aleksiciae]|uniref:Oxidoreductase n=1 Tax=Yersinia aleksiciae TaxID=263819 RepID=A0A0T9TSQ9_YERAE|nr:GNAT family N-acetyltransferase [Yersinia aleksiciae]MDA5497840.1 GNAT family N-acetyltransferase [Yersinia aleksiciae]NIK99998.1 GNAT family N-acetyltransferase [Yersinia aleksiciae]WQC70003.1 GNAT family N-acetyltransferase [Yersinia aleksiciae]CNK99652.1 oxidoreductase [Yersinia aleksiciae]